jgi:hypothetical protein
MKWLRDTVCVLSPFESGGSRPGFQLGNKHKYPQLHLYKQNVASLLCSYAIAVAWLAIYLESLPECRIWLAFCSPFLGSVHTKSSTTNARFLLTGSKCGVLVKIQEMMIGVA